MQVKHSFALRIISVSILIVLVFGLILNHLLTYSFWIDEGYSAWLVRDEMRDPETIREVARFTLASLSNSLEHIRNDVHPPLYYLLLDVWTLLLGDSEFVLRLPSALLATLSLSAIYALGRQYFNSKTGIIALILLGTSGFYLYYAREARMYSLYLALATLSTWAYYLWWRKPSILRGLLYGFILSLMLYTHYTSFTIILAHLIHAIITVKSWTGRGKWWQIIIPLGLATLAFTPWLAVLLDQLAINTNFAPAGAIPSDWGTASAIWLKLTSGYWGIFALVLILSRTLLSVQKKTSELLLFFLVGFVPIIALFTINAQGLTILQLRYLIPILSAWSVIIAYLLSEMWIPFLKNQRVGLALTVFFTGWIAYTQVATYHIHWVAKPDWRLSAMTARDNRDVQEPALVYLDARSPLTYYDTQMGLLDGISIDFRWREFTAQELEQIIARVNNAPVVWSFLEMQAPTSWDIIAEMTSNRGISYRDSVQGTILYAFDENSDEQLSFTFGINGETQQFAYDNDDISQYEFDSNNEICVEIDLDALGDIDDSYMLRLQLIRGYNEVIAQSEAVVTNYLSGDSIEERLCITADPEANLHLGLMIVSQDNNPPLYLMENNLLWGNRLILGITE